MSDWRKLLENRGSDLGERSSIRRENSLKFNSDIQKHVEELKSLYEKHCDYLSLKRLFEDSGYEVREIGGTIRIFKEYK